VGCQPFGGCTEVDTKDGGDRDASDVPTALLPQESVLNRPSLAWANRRKVKAHQDGKIASRRVMHLVVRLRHCLAIDA
jgi:hypothetical protein